MLGSTLQVHKLKCVAQDDIPTRLEIQQNLGTLLAQVFLDYSHYEATNLLDSVSSVKQQSKQCSCTPQDSQLEQSTSQSLPNEQENLKLRVHEDILAMGKIVLKKFQTEIEATVRDMLSDEFADKYRALEAEKRFAVRRNAEEIHCRYEEYFDSAQRELEEKLRIEWENESAKHKKELQKAVVKTRINTTHNVLRNLRSEMQYIIQSLYNDLEQSYRAKREIIIADFNEIMRKQHVKLDARIKEVKRKKMEELRVQRHELEIQNAADIIHVLCMERLRSNTRMQMANKNFEERIESLQKFIAKQDETIIIMKERIAEYRSKNKRLQEKIIAITNEFQKFINLMFDTIPKHADFLLPLDLFVNGKESSDEDKESSEQEKG